MKNSTISDLLDERQINDLKAKGVQISLMTAGALTIPNKLEAVNKLTTLNAIKFLVNEYNFKYKQELSLVGDANNNIYNITIIDNGADISQQLYEYDFIVKDSCIKISQTDNTGTYRIVYCGNIAKSELQKDAQSVTKVSHYILGDKLCDFVSQCIYLNHDFNAAMSILSEDSGYSDNLPQKYQHSYNTKKNVTKKRITDNGLFYSSFDKDTIIPTPLANQIKSMSETISEGGHHYMCKSIFFFYTKKQ